MYSADITFFGRRANKNMLRQLKWGCVLLILSIFWFFFTLAIVKVMYSENHMDVDIRYQNNVVYKLDILEKQGMQLEDLLAKLNYQLKENTLNENTKSTVISMKPYKVQVEPSIDYENLRRRLYLDIQELWYFVTSEISQMKKDLISTKLTETKINNFLDDFAEYKRFIVNDISNLSQIDGYKEWRINENEKLTNLVQKRLHYLQHPQDCKTAKKLTCDITESCGFGCQLHHVVDCFIMAYATERTLVFKSQTLWKYGYSRWEEIFLPLSNNCTTTDGESHGSWPKKPDAQVVFFPYTPRVKRPPFLPLNIPKDLSDRLMRIHGDPIVWWVGQFLKYLFRPQPEIQQMLNDRENRLNFKSPIVGVQIRRTDKVGTEASFHDLDEYMHHVEEYYKDLQTKQRVTKKRIYIATDDPEVFKEVSLKYPDYEIVGDVNISRSAAVENRSTKDSLIGIVSDIYFLSKTDYLVCTFSSRVCRLAYEIMNSVHYDASQRYHSLDDIYYYAGQDGRYQVVIQAHRAKRQGEIDLEIGDLVSVAGNHWDGYSKGTNTRTSQTGLYPSFKVAPRVEIKYFPTYSQLPEE